MSVSITSQNAPHLLNPQISTGNVATVNDPYSATISGINPFGNGARNTPGMKFYAADSAGRILTCRYVRLNPTVAPAAYIVGPVYWKDAPKTVVTATLSEAYTAEASNMAGILLLASATPATMTGNWVVIVTRGFLSLIPVCAATAKGDELFGTTGDQTFDRIATGTAPLFPGHDCRALTDVAANKSSVWVDCEGA